MARAARPKVYRTPIGFHDAYVAAPSQKAALAAWGSAHDLCSTGEAETVTDPALAEEPLSKPGQIIRRPRGTTAEHLAALPAEPKREPGKARPAVRAVAAPRRKAGLSTSSRPARALPIPRPAKPDRTAVDAAKAKLKALLDQRASDQQALKRREEALIDERRDLQSAHKAAAATLRSSLKAAEVEYRQAIAAWRRLR